MEEDDLLLVLSWRNQPSIRTAMYTEHEISLEEHQRWFQRTQEAGYAGKHYLCCCDKVPFGVVNFTDISRQHHRLHWGFYMGAAKRPPGGATAMGFLALREAFETLGIHKVIGEVLGNNAKSLRYHQRLGFLQEGLFKEHVFKAQEGYVDVICFGYLVGRWAQQKKRLLAELEDSFQIEEVK